jgi:hypothetical protein
MGQSFITLNGKRYDAKTGAQLDVTPPAAQQTVDGIFHPAPHPTAETRQPKAHHARSVAAHAQRHTPQKTHILMRRAVKKPSAAPATTPLAALHKPSHHAASTADSRLRHALKTAKHQSVHRFSQHPAASKARLAPLPVVTPRSDSVAPKTTTAPPADDTQRQTAQIFVDSQLAKAATHAEAPRSTAKRSSRVKRLTSIAALTASGLAIAAFVLYQQAPMLSLSFASKKSGITMSLPKGIPSNFKLSRKIEYGSGTVTLYYTSRSDDRSFTITKQRAENMSSESLQSALAQNKRVVFQPYDADGLTLFVSDGGAEWVDGDSRLSLNGKSGLSADQLSVIASSL